MFSFLNRHKNEIDSVQINRINEDYSKVKLIDDSALNFNILAMKKTLYESIIKNRTDIVIALINAWLKGLL